VSELGRFGPYTVYECVGSGGMATVHRASISLEGNVELEVALKRLLPHLADDDRFVEDFVREAKLAAHLRHANIVRVFELGKIGQTYFIAMELVRGASLGSMMRKSTSEEKRPSLGAVFSLMLELTDALDHAHNGTNDHGQPLRLVHRDLTPSNLLITDDGHLKIIDFGVAKAMSGDLSTNSGYAKGKIGYMSPEALAGQPVDARADIFSAGVVLWELLTSRRLFQPTHDWDTSVHDKPIEPPSAFNRECTPELDRVVLRAVALQREDRFPSADAMHEALVKAARPFASTSNAKAVVRWKRTLRVESNFEPYANFVLEEAPAPKARGSSSRDPEKPSRPGKPSRPITPHIVQRTWPVEPTTQPERMGAWPPEPTTTPKITFVADTAPETAPVPETLIPSDFDGEAVQEPPPVVGRRSTRRKVKPPPIPTPKRKGAPLRPPGPSPMSDRIPLRTPLDTEPTPTLGREPVDTEPNPVVDDDAPTRGKR
jgi:serine/threonine protein kinase